MDPTARFAACLGEDPLPLDTMALLIAAHAHAELDLATSAARLDRLAIDADTSSPAALCAWLFGPAGFRGNDADYYDPENSFLDAVLDRRVGIPITLSVVAIEVGRRAGIELLGVGLPGHFLLRDASEPDRYFDTFDGGCELSTRGVEDLFRRVHSSAQPFDERLAATVPTIDIVRRMLTNLMAIYVENATLHHLAWVLRLRTMLPDTHVREFVQLASVLSRLGRYGEAALVYERLALLEPDRAQAHRTSAIRVRAASN